MIARGIVLAATILAGGLCARTMGGPETPIARPALVTLPSTLGNWTAAVDTAPDAATLEVLRVDDYLNRTYAGPAHRRVNLYVGYWSSQRQGDTIHSPQNCLPGAGWQPIESSRLGLDVRGHAMPVTRYLVERSGERQLAYYWFQGRGRVTANEYANKFWLMVDAARLRRSGGGLVRVMTALAPMERVETADGALADFVERLSPHLGSYLP